MKKTVFFILCIAVVTATLIQCDKSVTYARVSFPSELGMGQTWNRSLTKRVGQVIGLEARRSGVTEISLPPFQYGESPYLVAELGIEMTKGLHATCPVTGMDRINEGDVKYRAAFERIIQESGVLDEKTYEPLRDTIAEALRQEQEEHEAVALQAFRESMVLLKNENSVLPVDTSKQVFFSLNNYPEKEQKEKLVDAGRSDIIAIAWDAVAAGQEESKKWLEALGALGKPVVLVLSGNQTFAIDPDVEQLADAILAAWFPGVVHEQLVADVICGNYNPGSRLATTLYDTQGEVLYPMGYGLSYTTVAYSDFTLEPVETEKGKTVVARFKVTNTGGRASDEVALLYVRNVSGDGDTFGTRLEAFKRTHLEPGETKEVKFTIRRRNVERVDAQMNRSVVPGVYQAFLSADVPARNFTVDTSW